MLSQAASKSNKWNPCAYAHGLLLGDEQKAQTDETPVQPGGIPSAFVAASLQQLIAAARLPNSGISEIAVNASLAFIEGAKPRDEIECALVIQMACTHSAAMAVAVALK